MTRSAVMNDLSFEELNELSFVLQSLTTAGEALLKADFAPRFNLAPGYAPQITLTAYVMPAQLMGVNALTQPAEPWVSDIISPTIDDLVMDFDEPASDGWVVFPIEEAPAEEEPADIAPLAPTAVEVVGEDIAASEADAGPKYRTWTAEEDAEAIKIYVAEILGGQIIKAAAQKVCDALDRPYEGTRWRLVHKLAKPIEAELLRARNEAALAATATEQPIPAAAFVAPYVADGADTGGNGISPSTAVAATPKADTHLTVVPEGADELTSHLLSMPRRDGWTIERDLDLASMTVSSGWGIRDIALDFGIDGKAVQARWDALTGLHKDAKTGKPLRRFLGADLLTRLTALVQG